MIGGYQIEKEIGVGGMARVFRARDTNLGRVVALKVLVPAPADGEFRESRAASMVDHPNIILIYAAGGTRQ